MLPQGGPNGHVNVIEACAGYDRISCPEGGQKKIAEHSGYPGASPGCKVFGMIFFVSLAARCAHCHFLVIGVA